MGKPAAEVRSELYEILTSDAGLNGYPDRTRIQGLTHLPVSGWDNELVNVQGNSRRGNGGLVGESPASGQDDSLDNLTILHERFPCRSNRYPLKDQFMASRTPIGSTAHQLEAACR